MTLGWVLLAAAPPAAAASAWSRPFRLAAPVALDVAPAQIAFSAAGDTAVGYSVEDMDLTAGSSARLLQGRGGHAFGPSRTVAGQQQLLAMGYGPSGLGLITGSSRARQSCCSEVQVFSPVHGGSLGRSQTLVSGLAGATSARVLNVTDRMLAVVGTERGIWVSQSAAGGRRFPGAHRLSSADQLPQSLDAVALGRGNSVVAWTARLGQVTASGPRTVYVARGTSQQAPRHERVAVSVAPGHSVDEIALARGYAFPGLAWIESWFDRLGNYHSQVKVADLVGRPRPQAVSSDGELAAGLAFASDGRGDQALSWKACTDSGSCAVRVVLRRARGRFGSVQRPGPIDAAENPADAVTSGGTALVGWIHGGNVFAGSSQTTRMSGGRTLGHTAFATDLTLASAPGGGALAVWTQGTLAQSVTGADFRAR